MAISKIEWTDATWNPVTGCSKISLGCQNCYAERMSYRLKSMGQEKYCDGFAVKVHPDKIDEPMKWHAGKFIFVNSMSDLFHEEIPLKYIRAIFDVMNQANWHIFQILTKRSDRLVSVAKQLNWTKNIWIGVSVESEKYLYRINHLKKVPAAVRYVSFEPLLGPIDKFSTNGLNWIIVGGESGPGARYIDPKWVRRIRDISVKNNIPFFFKQWGGTRKLKTGRSVDGIIWDQIPQL